MRKRLLIALIATVLVAYALPLAAAEDEEMLVTLQVSDTSVGEVLRILADRSGLNIVVSPEVATAQISIRITDTPFSEALNLIVRAAGLGYERVGSTILVGDLARLEMRTGLITRVFKLQHANPEVVALALEVITDDATFDHATNSVIVRATHSELEQINDVIAELDRKPGQVLFEARMIEVNTTKLEELGINWEQITKFTTKVTEGYHGTGQPGQFPVDIDYTELGEVHRLYRQDHTFELTLDALISEGHATLLTNTKIVTIDGEPAEIFAGETVPVVITSLQSPGASGGTLQSIQLEKIDVGVKLNITPRICDGDLITTLVEPEVSRIIQFVGPDEDLPETSTRRARALVRMGNGETIYLGGLLSEEERTTVKKVPLLGDIPLLGHLFRHTKKELDQFDLIIELRPTIVGDRGDDLPTTASVHPEPLGSKPAAEPAGGDESDTNRRTRRH